MKLKFQVATIALLFAGLGIAGGVSGEGGLLSPDGPFTGVSDGCDAVFNATTIVETCPDYTVPGALDSAVDGVDTLTAGGSPGPLPGAPECGLTPSIENATCALEYANETASGAVEALLSALGELPVDPSDATAAFCTVFATATSTDETACNDAITAQDPTYFSGILTGTATETVDALLAALGPSIAFDASPTGATPNVAFTVSGTFEDGILAGLLNTPADNSDPALTLLHGQVNVTVGGSDLPVVLDGHNFSADYTPATTGTFTFTATVSFTEDTLALLTGEDSLDVDVAGTSGGGTYVNVTVPNTVTDFALDTSGITPPTAGAASSGGFFVLLTDDNGVADINQALTVTFTGPGFTQTLANGAATNTTTTSQYDYVLSFPVYLKDGNYNITATYGTTPLYYEFTVANVGPSATATASAGESQIGGGGFVSSPVTLTLDDANWGAYDGSGVTELASIGFTVSPANLNITATATPTDLSGVSRAATPYDLAVTINHNGGDDAGTYTITATVTDDDGAFVDLVFYTLTVLQPNVGFLLTVDDGGDGTQLGSIAPGATGDSGADPLTVNIAGDIAATALLLDLPDFTDGAGHSIAADGVIVRVLSGGIEQFTSTVSGNGLYLDLAGNGLGGIGTSVDLVFELTVPVGTSAGDYSSAATVSGIQAA